MSAVAERFWSKVDLNGAGGCWLWTAATARGYGQFWNEDRKVVRAHRWAYEALVGTVTEGLELDHLCRERACVNPAHLEPVTHGENVRRSPLHAHRVKTECPQGHDYDEANTYHHPSGRRRCRACNAAAQRRKG